MPNFVSKAYDQVRCGEIKHLRGKGGFKIAMPVIAHKGIMRFVDLLSDRDTDENDNWFKWRAFLIREPNDGIIPIERKLPDHIKIRKYNIAELV